MMLIIGGAASGKRTYARCLGFADNDMADACIDERPVVFNAQDIVATLLDEAITVSSDGSGVVDGKELSIASQLADALSSKQVVICNEVGSGIVPLGWRDRTLREQVGKLSSILAEKADVVVRMVCGIPVFLKGSASDVECLAFEQADPQ